METRESQWSDIWYWLVSFLTLASLWASAANALSPYVTDFLLERGLGSARPLAAICLAGIVLGLLGVTRFAGPLRASNAEIAWRTRETLPSHQMMQVLGVDFLVAAFAGVPLVIFAANIGWSTVEIVAMAAFVAAAAPLSVAWGAFRQRRGSSVPRWSLMRSDANVNGAFMTLMTLDGTALRLASDQRDSGRRRRIVPRASSPLIRFFVVTAARSFGHIWKMFAAATLATAAALGWVSPPLSLGIALVLAIAMAVASAGPWCDWVTESHVRHGFARLGPRANTSILFGSALWPTIFLIASLAAVGLWFFLVQPEALHWQLLWWIVIVLGLPLYVVCARGVAALRSAGGREGEEFVNTAELGPIPVGLIRRLTSGWLGAGVIAIATVFSPAVSALLLLMSGLATRFSYIRLYSNLRESS